ncbi:MAG: LamB/YcsF family protein [Bacillota bacterium]|nr:MAG: LamB/YcsF family protein [Bacillota bacterium]
MRADRTGHPAVDLNSDLGESFGVWRLGQDEAMLDYVTSANIACGLHAGDPGVMRRTVSLAVAKGVAIGAHPGYPDLQGFGRRAMALTGAEITDCVLYQIGALQAIARAEGGVVSYVKPHGALYNKGETDPDVARAVAEAVRLASAERELRLVASSDSPMAQAAEEAGLPFVPEVFGDRAYDDAGRLVPRSRPGSVVSDPEEVEVRVTGMVLRGEVKSVGGRIIPIKAGTVCLHGDTPGAPALARAVRSALERSGVRVTAFA